MFTEKPTEQDRTMLLIRRRHLLAAAGATALPPALFAQGAWPNKPVRIVVPFAAGGTTDILARALAPELGKAFGQSFIVDNKPGAGGNVGADLVAKSAPDGYNLLMGAKSRTGSNGILGYSATLMDCVPTVPMSSV